jgi:hypothetical protein
MVSLEQRSRTGTMVPVVHSPSYGVTTRVRLVSLELRYKEKENCYLW